MAAIIVAEGAWHAEIRIVLPIDVHELSVLLLEERCVVGHTSIATVALTVGAVGGCILLVLRRVKHGILALVMASHRWTTMATLVNEHRIFVHKARLRPTPHGLRVLTSVLILHVVRVHLTSVVRHHRASHMRGLLHHLVVRGLH